MTTVTATMKNRCYTSLTVEGHANFADSGEDLVCAAISSIVFGLANAIQMVEGDKNIHMDSARFFVENVRHDTEISCYLRCVTIQLKTLEEAYPENIQVKILGKETL